MKLEENKSADIIDLIFSPEGLLAKSIPGYESRTEQRQMAEKVFTAYNEKKTALVEAGTGTGKSLAYLAPAIYWALRYGEKTVISTHTIALQEQLIQKDIPTLIKIMGAEIEAVLVKGMGNYLCLRKLDEEHQKNRIFGSRDREIENIENWANQTSDGTRSDISFPLAPENWERVNAEVFSCNGSKCPHYKRCFFFKARRKVEEAQILVVNHHLLVSDLKGKVKGKDKTTLPAYSHVIVDEAHHFSDVARHCLSRRTDKQSLIRQLGRLHSDLNQERSRFYLIRQKITSPKLQVLLETELPAKKREVVAAIDKAFKLLELLCKGGDQKRLRENDLRTLGKDEAWKSLIEQFSLFLLGLGNLCREIDLLREPQFQNDLLELEGILQSLQDHFEAIENFTTDDHRVRWLEKTGMVHPNILLQDGPIEVDDFLKEHFFDSLSSAVLCSATLSTEKNFRYVKNQLGLEAKRDGIIEGIYDSPFDYNSRSLFLIPNNLPEPSDPNYFKLIAESVGSAIRASDGSALVLFTSYEMLESVYQKVSSQPMPDHIRLMRQGDSSRYLLLENFKKREGNVLFGTDTFWEGIDIPGEALRCVIITKLPFRVPTDPLLEAKAERIAKAGGDPFKEYAIPQAIVKFKQGFGRLMRKHGDRGTILCLDKRLATRPYGKIFINSLPKIPVCIAPAEEIYLRMQNFYEEIGA